MAGLGKGGWSLRLMVLIFKEIIEKETEVCVFFQKTEVKRKKETA